MRNLYLYFLLFFCIPTISFSQIGKNYQIGDIANETFEVYDTNKVAVKLKVPDDDGYLIVWNYRWVNAGRGVDTKDSMDILQKKIAEIIVGGMLGKLRVVVLSYDNGGKYDEWINDIKKENPLKANTRFKIEF